ncbi:hypothetical protein BJX63DRAFT_208147 [Aspergillus granulosus]|uniref:Uncharacterized protein n=1 Tax=Aspergillus granulosus TaxID=176169 RepID=A0ABR4HEF6_9EURO
MHSFSALGPADCNPWINPGIRRIGFTEEPAQFTVAHLLVHGWGVKRETPECKDPPTGDFADWAQELNSLTNEEREQLPRDEDQESVHTPWRDQIYYMWNHVFYDVGNWMSSGYGTRSFVPPGVDVFVIRFPETCGNRAAGVDANGGDEKKKYINPAAIKSWPESEALLAPAYLAPGISVRVETLEPGQAEDAETFHPGDFNHEARYDVWYVKKGLRLKFFVEGTWDEKSAGGLAAIMVWVNMLGDPVPNVSSDVEEDNEGEVGKENDEDVR